MANAIIGNVFIQQKSVGVALGNANPSKGVYVEFEPNEPVFLPASLTPRTAFYTYASLGVYEIRWWEDDETRPATASTSISLTGTSLVAYVPTADGPMVSTNTRLKCLETSGPHSGMARICEFDSEIFPLIKFAADPLI
jgi:hypothetical protein